MVEFNAAGTVWRGDGGGFVAQLAAPVGVDGPRGSGVFTGPVGGERDVFSDGFAEVVGGVAGEPSVELVAVAYRVGGGSFGPAVRGGALWSSGLVFASPVSKVTVWVESAVASLVSGWPTV